MTSSRSAMQLRNTSLPIRVSRGGSQISVMATQWAKVDVRRAVTHEVDFNEPLAVFTCPRADAVKVAWETETFNASTAKAAIRQCSRLAGLVHGKGDRRERETAFESKAAQLCPWCKDIGVVRFFADTDLTEGAALSKHPSAVLDTSRAVISLRT